VTGDSAGFVAGLRQLADFLEAHPDLPAPYGGETVTAFPEAGEEEAVRVAAVDHAAAVLGVEARWRAGGGQYVAVRVFAGAVAYAVAVVTGRYMARYDAERSYAGSVTPWPAGEAEGGC